MTTLRDIRRRLRSVENIKKITDAMERIAAVRLRKAYGAAEDARPYVAKIKEILQTLSAIDPSNPLFHQKDVNKIGVVIIAADKGLSGAYNANILMAADRFLKNYSASQAELFLFGKKAVEHYSKKPWIIREKKTEWGGKITLNEIKHFSNQLMELFISGEYDEIWLIYTHYKSVLTRKTMVEKFLNIEKLPVDAKGVNLNYIYEPNPSAILNELIPRYCITRIQTALQESYASELASRIIAMKMASKNSEEMIERLTLQRNKIRQSNITKEMIEISLGSKEMYG